MKRTRACDEKKSRISFISIDHHPSDMELGAQRPDKGVEKGADYSSKAYH